jgi:hypothetical protein
LLKAPREEPAGAVTRVIPANAGAPGDADGVELAVGVGVALGVGVGVALGVGVGVGVGVSALFIAVKLTLSGVPATPWPSFSL